MPVIMKENVQYAYTDKGIKAHTLSYAEYQALSTEEKMNGDLYFIPDKQPEGNPSLIWDKLGTATLDTDADNVSDAVNELNSNLTQSKSRTLLCRGVPSANTSYNLNESVNNFDYIEIIICKANTGGGAFQNRIISKDNLAVGQPEALALSAYNSSSYRLHMECGFSSDRIFTIATYNCVGWNMSVVYVVGIGRK